jgi:hypothetical protein
MSLTEIPPAPKLGLKIGEWVEVRSEAEILATLDEKGELDGLLFMPEMLQFCGQRLRVDKLALKLCDSINWTGMYRMRDAVHLADAGSAEVRCDGSAHGGCQAGCSVYWKEAWLRRASEPPAGEPVRPAGPVIATLETLAASTRKAPEPGADPATPRYACQTTELLRAAPERIPSWDARQYVEDVRSGNAGPWAAVRAVAVGFFNEFQDLTRRFLPERLRIKGGLRYPFFQGTLDKTPDKRLGLHPGDLVRVKSVEEIVATLDHTNRNRGMTFDVEMVKFCGREARVLRRVEKIIDEKSGVMLEFSNPCIVLEGAVCGGDFHRLCPRGTYPYWREIWLERVPEPTTTV